MADILGVPSLGRVCNRIAQAETVDSVIVATSDESADNLISDWLDANGVQAYRGPLNNVLSRTLGAAHLVGASVVVFINGDSPLADPRIIDLAVARHREGDADYVSSFHGGGGYPDGFSVEVFATRHLAAIQEACGEAADAREHVTIPFYGPRSQFDVAVLAPPEAPPPDLHLSLDTAADLALARDIFARLLPTYPNFGYEHVMELLRRDDELLRRATAS
jgi:spore coat polysaccharide biosynthesis protein SpsF